MASLSFEDGVASLRRVDWDAAGLDAVDPLTGAALLGEDLVMMRSC